MSPAGVTTLDEVTYREGISELVDRHPHLEEAVSRWGPPPLWTHPAGYSGIVLSILSQQVSLESAQAAFTKLNYHFETLNPSDFLSLDDAALKAVGFSRQKAEYVRGISREIIEGSLDLDELEALADERVMQRLTALRGIGAWTAGAYLLFALRRADAWPSGDLALIKAVQELRGLTELPSPDEVDKMAEDWKPWRSIAARILWHHYLRERGRASSL